MRVLALALLLWPLAGWPAEFVHVKPTAALLYDAPSDRAKPLFILGSNLPLEVVLRLKDWVKVRDASGSTGWISPKSLGGRRMGQVVVARATVQERAAINAPAVMQLVQGDLIAIQDASTPGWLRVKLESGRSGYLQRTMVWGG